MLGKLKLPMGVESFEDIRKKDFYYVDKTGLIKELLGNESCVTLFTRPRRFGKTLTMNMLRRFFETGGDSTLFDGLEISKDRELCGMHMGKYPVISISLKDVSGGSFETAKKVLRSVIGDEAMRFQFLLQSSSLTDAERQQYKAFIDIGEDGEYAMSDELLSKSILTLSSLLHKHYGQKAVVLIDEYDVPLDKAYHLKYYDEMINLIRTLFGRTLKTNESLNFAVLTGCLRISKESIFTGLNNFKVYTVKDVKYNEYFGFTDGEVREMLEYYGLMGQYDAVKAWYDGYRIGGIGIYCPWDVVNCCADLRDGNATRPQNYWVNSSGNDIVRRFIDKADDVTKSEIELLINGGSVKKKIRQELTYRDLDSDIGNIWSILFTTGYLTQCAEEYDEITDMVTTVLVIPNREIRWIYMQQIQEWFECETKKDRKRLEAFCQAFAYNNTQAIEEGFNAYLKKTISIRDTSVRKGLKENFYHGILLGLFVGMGKWRVKSNAESGEGYSDICVEVDDGDIGIVIEIKYAENAAFDIACDEALRQIRDKDYDEALIDDGMKIIYRYGIACYKKRCRVVSEKRCTIE